MAFPGEKQVFRAGEGLCNIKADTLNKIINMLDSLHVVLTDEDQNYADPATCNGDGANFAIKIPSGGNFPKPPGTGDYILTSQNGVLSWVALSTFTCPEGT